VSEHPILSKEIVWAHVLPEIRRHIERQNDAKQALNTLVNLGCDRNQILRQLYMYVAASPKDVRALKRELSWKREQILTTAKNLEKVALEVEKANANLALSEFHLSNSPEQEMRSYGELLQRFGNSLFSQLASGRISGREHHLVVLAEMIERSTGTQHYKEIGVL
jgi:hypothetical protein